MTNKKFWVEIWWIEFRQWPLIFQHHNTFNVNFFRLHASLEKASACH